MELSKSDAGQQGGRVAAGSPGTRPWRIRLNVVGLLTVAIRES